MKTYKYIIVLLILVSGWLLATPVVCGISNKVISGTFENACGTTIDFTGINY